MGRTSHRDAADDREIERIMNMTDADAIASVGGFEAAERIADEMRHMVDTAWIEAERRRQMKTQRG